MSTFGFRGCLSGKYNFIVKNEDTASTSMDVVVVYLLLAFNRYYRLGHSTACLVGIYLFKFNK